MHGNVAEWCRDHYDPDFYEKSPRLDPVYTARSTSGGVNVYRGGSFLLADACRSADRQSSPAPPESSPIKHLGFRVIVEVDQPSTASTDGAEQIPKTGQARMYAKWPFDSSEAKGRQKETAAALGVMPVVTLPLGNSKTEMNFALIPAGTFLMGSPADEKDRRKEEVQHGERIDKPFYMSSTEVTEAQWRAVTGLDHLLGPKRNDNLPVHKVAWTEAIDFCKRFKQKTDLNIQLPSEAQWEYACRAGSAEAFCFGSDGSKLRYYATYKSKGKDAMAKVKQNRSNAFGLYDMHGNVYELCRDYQDPRSGVMLRGGSHLKDAGSCRSASREAFTRGKDSDDVGLRVIFSLPDKAKPAFRMVKAAAVRY